MKLKAKPSARIKRRYILLDSGKKEDAEKAILDYIGILGWARAAPIFITGKKDKLVISVDRKEVDNVRAAFELSSSGIKISKVSGTLKGLSN